MQVNITNEQNTRLLQFADQHGPDWRDALRLLWLQGIDATQPDGHLLRQIRNTVGPSKLEKVMLRY
jgi:hypothetical protein